LPQKKSKLKGQKQPKQLPVQQQHSNAPEPQQQHQQQQQQQLINSEQQQQQLLEVSYAPICLSIP